MLFIGTLGLEGDLSEGQSVSPVTRLGTGTAFQIAYAPDGRLLAVASSVGLGLFEASTLTMVRILQGHTDWVRAVAFSPDGRLLASGSGDATVLLWDVTSRLPDPLTQLTLTPPVVVEQELPMTCTLFQNYPNPFNPETTISYVLPEVTDIHVTLYDLAGRTIRTLIRGPQRPGHHEVVWDGCDAEGRDMASGIYFYRLEAIDREAVQTRRMVLVR
jgi:WD40 repeat protein